MNNPSWVILVALIMLSLSFMQKNMNERILVVIIVILLSVFFSIVISLRPIAGDIATFKNDTQVYAGFVECIKSNSMAYCNDYIGAPWFEYILGVIAKISVLVGGGYLLFFFLVSLIFVLSCVSFYLSLGTFLPLALFFLVLQTQFWEFNANILRHSISASIFLLLMSLVLHCKVNVSRIVPLSFIGIFSHSSSFFYSLSLIFSTRLNVFTLYLALVFFSISGEFLFEYLFNFVDIFSVVGDEKILYKMMTYQATDNVNLSFLSSVGTVNFFIVFSFFYFKYKVDDPKFDFVLKLLLLILICGAIFSGTEISYRVINVYILLVIYLIIYLVKQNIKYSSLLAFLFLSWSFYGFVVNSEVILRYFDWS